MFCLGKPAKEYFDSNLDVVNRNVLLLNMAQSGARLRRLTFYWMRFLSIA